MSMLSARVRASKKSQLIHVTALALVCACSSSGTEDGSETSTQTMMPATGVSATAGSSATKPAGQTTAAAAGTSGATPAAGTMTAAGGAGTKATSAAAGAGATTSAAAGTGAATSAAAGSGTSSAAAGSSASAAAGSSASSAGAAGKPATAGAAGGSAAGGAAGGGAASGGAATFTMVYDALFASSAAAGCGSCHGGAANPSLNGGFGGLMAKDAAYTALVGMTSSTTMCMGKTYVSAGKPDDSLLYQKVAGTQMCGMRMPPGGMVAMDKIMLVKDWITAGAKND